MKELSLDMLFSKKKKILRDGKIINIDTDI